MDNLRIYGKPPYNTAVIHGGPGAAGEMAPVARELSGTGGAGILEPLQTAATLEGQVAELKAVLEKKGDLPVTLIGFSWGAWLGYILAAEYPGLVKKLILVGSGGFEEKYGGQTLDIRLERLEAKYRDEAEALVEILNDPAAGGKRAAFARLGAMFSTLDAYDPVADEAADIPLQPEVYHGVWKDAEKLRRNGRLLELGQRITCPVVAIHGDYDPHPAEGVRKPLEAVLGDFRFHLLEHCGHKPWIEKAAKDEFYALLQNEVST